MLFRSHFSHSFAQLQALATNARGLFVGAYDGEGYLIWENRVSPDSNFL